MTGYLASISVYTPPHSHPPQTNKQKRERELKEVGHQKTDFSTITLDYPKLKEIQV